MTMSSSRFAPAALLLVGSAALAVVMAIATTPGYARAKVPALDSLPWSAVKGVAPVRAPIALLYVQSSCSHCSAAAVALDSIARHTRVRAVVLTSDDGHAADGYRAKLGLREPIALDTSKAMMHALGVHAVPTLIVFAHDGSARVAVGFRGAAAYRRILRSVE
jgi:hypothetical protein